MSWLLKAQAKNGSFGGGTVDRGPERQQHGSGRLGARRRWRLRQGRQGRRTGSGKLFVNDVSGENGAIAYDKAALAGAEDGISVDERDQFIRSTAQAGPALRFAFTDGCP